MPSYASEVQCTAESHPKSAVHLADQRLSTASDHKRKRAVHKNYHDSLLMFSDPVDDSSSDTKSFDVDDMYGSDPDVETISMKPLTTEEPTSSDENNVCTLWLNITYVSHLKQDYDFSTQLQRMEANIDNLSIVMEALCDTDMINDVSSLSDEVHQSPTSSQMVSEVEESDHDITK